MKFVLILGCMLVTLGQGSAQLVNTDTLVPNSAARMAPYHRPLVIKPHPFLLPIARASVQGSYPLELSFSKTTHIVFPTKIKDFDAGSGVIIATVPDKLLNVLRVKADIKGFLEETNMTVFTEDGGLYSFLVRYNENPEVFALTLSNNRNSDERVAHSLGIGSQALPASPYVLPEGSYVEKDIEAASREVVGKKDFIKNIRTKKGDLQVAVKGIYLNQNKVMYLKLEMHNRSYLPYQIDFIKLFVRDRIHLRRMAVQKEEIPTILHYPTTLTHLNGEQKVVKVIAIPFQTLVEGKVLDLEIYERGGGRHISLQLTNDTLLKSKPL
ncbi:conjugative transposon protein TraN [Telluribacter humicola]|uniref:conjugative transposon protein TraN n=1 Tax=Telluribacter humicola TaxID=1720261 RepID=UPI001A96A472|nr:conjugative transposon protein TraN [Telluribacter humicola]